MRNPPNNPLAAPPKAVFDCPPPSFGLNAPALICSGQSSASPNILVWRANLSQLSALCEGAGWCICLFLWKVMVSRLENSSGAQNKNFMNPFFS